MSNVSQWSSVAANNNSASPDGAPEGMSPADINDVIRENMAAHAKVYADQKGTATTGGTTTAYTLTTSNAHAALGDIGLFAFQVNAANTGAATLAVDGLAAKAMQLNGAAIAAGDLREDEIVLAVYNPDNDVFDIFKSGVDQDTILAEGAGFGTDSPVARVEISGGNGAADDEGLSVTGTYSANTAHPFRVNSAHPLGTSSAVAGIDAQLSTTGSNNLDHIAAFQSRSIHNSSGTLDDFYAFYGRNFNTGGNVTNNYGMYLRDLAGGGTATNSYGVYVESLTVGTSLNYAWYSAGTTPSFFGGNVNFGSDITVNDGILTINNASDETCFEIDSDAITGNVVQWRAPTNSPLLYIGNEHASAPNGIYIDFTAASPNNQTRYFARFEDATEVKATLYSDGSLETEGSIGLNGVSPPSQAAHIADATDLASAITAVNAILQVLEDIGAVASS